MKPISRSSRPSLVLAGLAALLLCLECNSSSPVEPSRSPSSAQLSLTSPECFQREILPERRKDMVSLRLPFALNGRRLTNFTARSEVLDRRSVNVSLCEHGFLVLTARREGAYDEKLMYSVSLDWGPTSPNATNVWFFWSYEGNPACGLKGQRWPALALISEGPAGKLAGSKVKLYLESVPDQTLRGVKLGGLAFDRWQFNKTDKWYEMTHSAISLEDFSVTIEFNNSEGEQSVEVPFSELNPVAQLHSVTCYKNGGGMENEKMSRVPDSVNHTAWLAACTCIAIAIVIGIGVVLFVRQEFNVAQFCSRRSGSCHHLSLRVAITGDDKFVRGRAGDIRQSLSKKGSPLIFNITDLAGLRRRSSQFDLVLLFLGQDAQQELPQEVTNLIALERWRFRILLLEAPAPTSQVSRRVEEVMVRTHSGESHPASGVLLDEVLSLVRDACRKAEARSSVSSDSEEDG